MSACTGTIEGVTGEDIYATSGVVWPLSGTTEPAELSSTFGPRIRGSTGKYDFHRGLDMHVPEGTPVRAIADGEIRIGGEHPDYRDAIIQLMHCDDPEPPAEMNDCQTVVYVNYQHLKSSYVSVGERVRAGRVIGTSGSSAAGIPHLHFEIRYGSLWQRSAIHPLAWLPHQDSGPPGLAIDTVDFTDPTSPEVTVTVTNPPSELDFVRVEVALFAGAETEPMSSQSYDIDEWNLAYTGDSDPNVNLDDPDFNDVTVTPEPFNSSSEEYVVHFRFRGLASRVQPDDVRVVARAKDVSGNAREATCAPCL